MMIYIILVFFLLTCFFLFSFIFGTLLRSDKRIENRMKRYLTSPETKLTNKQLNIFYQLKLAKNGIRKSVLTKEKNNKLEVSIARSGLPLKPEEYILFQWISIGFTGGIFGLVTDNWLFVGVGALLGLWIPKWYIKKKQHDRLVKFNESLPDMITTIVGSLRAGFSFPQALKTVGEEAQSPVKEEVERLLKEMQYGSSLEESLLELYERMPSEDLDLMIQAILIQRQVGGNLATVLDKIVETIRDRTRIQRQIKTLTAQGRMSGIVIGLLPIVLAFILYVIEPDYIGTLFRHPIGIGLLVAAVVSGMIGLVLIKKITTIEV